MHDRDRIMNALEVKQVGKVKGKQPRALKVISLTVGSGIVYALLGANGAGKTAFIRIVSDSKGVYPLIPPC